MCYRAASDRRKRESHHVGFREAMKRETRFGVASSVFAADPLVDES